MKLFLKYLAVFCLPIIILGVCCDILLRRIPNDYSYKRNYLDSNSEYLRVLFLGSSHAFYGVNPEHTKYRSFNASYVSQSLDYDFAIIKKYADKWNNLEFIVLPIDYFSLYTRLETGVEAWRTKNYKIYYGINTNHNLLDNTEILSNKFKTNTSKLYKFYFKHKSFITCSQLGWGIPGISNVKLNLDFSGETAAKRHFVTDDSHFTENVEVLKSIVEFAKAKNVKVLLYMSPAYKSYVQNLDNNQLTRTINAVTKIASDYNNVLYFNLLTNDSFTSDDFSDADHLNDSGAKKLTLKLDSIITKFTALSNPS